MKIYCMSDIHGCLAEFEEALSRIEDRLESEDTRLVLLGDYIHGRQDGRYVLDKIMELQYKYGRDKVVALMGNHEEFVLLGYSTIAEMNPTYSEEQEADDDKYVRWIENLPRYYTEGNTIFVHAGDFCRKIPCTDRKNRRNRKQGRSRTCGYFRYFGRSRIS